MCSWRRGLSAASRINFPRKIHLDTRFPPIHSDRDLDIEGIKKTRQLFPYIFAFPVLFSSLSTTTPLSNPSLTLSTASSSPQKSAFNTPSYIVLATCAPVSTSTIRPRTTTRPSAHRSVSTSCTNHRSSPAGNPTARHDESCSTTLWLTLATAPRAASARTPRCRATR